MTLSFDQHAEFYSLLSRQNPLPGNSRRSLRDLIQESQSFILRYFLMLPPIDYHIARLYYIDGLSQDQISNLFSITQAAVSRRLKFITTRVKFLLKMPTLNPIQVREDFLELFPDHLFEFAYFFYWENAQNRVKYFIKTSQSGAANKFSKVISYLEELTAAPAEGESDEQARRRYLALVYLEYFRYTRQKANIITYLFKKNDALRADCLVQGPSIF